MDYCRYCKPQLPFDQLIKCGRRPDGTQRFSCRPCDRKRMASQIDRGIFARRRKLSRAKDRTRQATYRALRTGLLVRPDHCEQCSRPPEAHHPDYTQPLLIRWLCRTHHVAIHFPNRPPLKLSAYSDLRTLSKKDRSAASLRAAQMGKQSASKTKRTPEEWSAYMKTVRAA
jgi:hypothetical protein